MRPVPLLLLLGAAACGQSPAPAAGGRDPVRHEAPTVELEATDAATLGHELFGLMDHVMAFKSSHFGGLPRDLTMIGEDSLTRTTVRRLSVAGAVPSLTVAFRHAEGHALTSCVGTNKVLEDSMLNGGPFEVTCTLPSGETKPFTVGG